MNTTNDTGSRATQQDLVDRPAAGPSERVALTDTTTQKGTHR
jgi:hypothetical protein